MIDDNASEIIKGEDAAKETCISWHKFGGLTKLSNYFYSIKNYVTISLFIFGLHGFNMGFQWEESHS